MRGGNRAAAAARFFRVEIAVGFGKKFFDALAITAVDGNADARGERGLFIVVGEQFANAIGNAAGFVFLCFRKDQGKFVAAITGGGIDGAAVDAENVGEAANGVAANEMAVVVVDFLEAVEVEEKHRKGPAAAVGALGFVFEDVEQAAIIGEASERIAHGEMADLLEEAGVINQSAAQGDGVAQDGKGLGEDERRIQEPPRLRGGELCGHVQPGSHVDGVVKGGIFHLQTTPIPDKANEKNGPRKQLLRAGEKCAGMAGDFGWETAKRGSDEIGESDHSQQSAGNLSPRVPRTRNEAIDKQGDDEQQRENHPAKPPGHRRPKEPDGRVQRELKEENAGGRQGRAREEEACAKNQRDAVLRALEADESDSGEDESQEAGDDLEITL